MDQLIISDVKMTSLDIAEVTGKEHKNIMRDIRNGLKNKTLTEADFIESDYINDRGRNYPCYEITKSGSDMLLNRYKATKSPTLPNVIYIVSHIGMDGYYKIGVTSNLDKRLSAFNNISPLGINLIHKRKTDEAMKLETKLHNLLSNQNTNLEWFNLTEKELSKVIKIIEGVTVNECAS